MQAFLNGTVDIFDASSSIIIVPESPVLHFAEYFRFCVHFVEYILIILKRLIIL